MVLAAQRPLESTQKSNQSRQAEAKVGQRIICSLEKNLPYYVVLSWET